MFNYKKALKKLMAVKCTDHELKVFIGRSLIKPVPFFSNIMLHKKVDLILGSGFNFLFYRYIFTYLAHMHFLYRACLSDFFAYFVSISVPEAFIDFLFYENGLYLKKSKINTLLYSFFFTLSFLNKCSNLLPENIFGKILIDLGISKASKYKFKGNKLHYYINLKIFKIFSRFFKLKVLSQKDFHFINNYFKNYFGYSFLKFKRF